MTNLESVCTHALMHSRTRTRTWTNTHTRSLYLYLLLASHSHTHRNTHTHPKCCMQEILIETKVQKSKLTFLSLTRGNSEFNERLRNGISRNLSEFEDFIVFFLLPLGTRSNRSNCCALQSKLTWIRNHWL